MEQRGTTTVTLPTGPRAILTYEGGSGSLTVEGADAGEVTITVSVQVRAEDDLAEVLRRVEQGIRHDGERVQISAPRLVDGGPWFSFGRASRIDYSVRVPRATECRLVGRSGRVEVSGVRGPVAVDGRSGRTAVRDVAAPVRITTRSGATVVERGGTAVEVQSQSGSIDVREVGGDLRAVSKSGRISIDRVGGRVDAAAESGRIDVNEVRGSARLRSASGRLTLTWARAAELRTVSGAIRFASPVLGDVTAEAVSGAIQVDVDPGRPFFIDAESQSGSVRSDLPPRAGAPPAPGSAPTVRLRTVSGSIRIGRLMALTPSGDAWQDTPAQPPEPPVPPEPTEPPAPIEPPESPELGEPALSDHDRLGDDSGRVEI